MILSADMALFMEEDHHPLFRRKPERDIDLRLPDPHDKGRSYAAALIDVFLKEHGLAGHSPDLPPAEDLIQKRDCDPDKPDSAENRKPAGKHLPDSFLSCCGGRAVLLCLVLLRPVLVPCCLLQGLAPLSLRFIGGGRSGSPAAALCPLCLLYDFRSRAACSSSGALVSACRSVPCVSAGDLCFRRSVPHLGASRRLCRMDQAQIEQAHPALRRPRAHKPERRHKPQDIQIFPRRFSEHCPHGENDKDRDPRRHGHIQYCQKHFPDPCHTYPSLCESISLRISSASSSDIFLSPRNAARNLGRDPPNVRSTK